MTVDPQPHDMFCKDHWFAFAQCRERSWAGPQLMLGVDLGTSVMNETGPFGFNQGVGAVTDAGPAWALRVGVELLPWLALEGRYVGMYNSAQESVSPLGSVGFLTTGGEAVVRLTAPLPYVHPYVFGGVGYYDNSLVGSATALPGSQLYSSNEPGFPMGFGLDVPLSWHLSLGLEATYHYFKGEVFSSNTVNGIDGGDISTANVVLRIRP
jgi:opacity protein-like surface antigen